MKNLTKRQLDLELQLWNVAGSVLSSIPPETWEQFSKEEVHPTGKDTVSEEALFVMEHLVSEMVEILAPWYTEMAELRKDRFQDQEPATRQPS